MWLVGCAVWTAPKPPPTTQTRDQVPSGFANLTIGPLGPECRGGCRATVALAVARPAGNRAAAPVPAVPKSLLFDPLSPHTPTGTVAISAPEVRFCVLI
jgi:hypothetical protein